MTMILFCVCLVIAPIELLALDATMGLYANDNSAIEILDESVFIGKEDKNVSQLWCKSDDDWDVCSWLWKDKADNYCLTYKILDTNHYVCTDDNMNVDRIENDCNLQFSSGFSRASHEGPWECRLSK